MLEGILIGAALTAAAFGLWKLGINTLDDIRKDIKFDSDHHSKMREFLREDLHRLEKRIIAMENANNVEKKDA